MNEPERYETAAADLDSLASVTTDALTHHISNDGACNWIRVTGMEPQWTGDDATDRALAAPICAECPVWRECLELEFRTVGYATTGVWGPLPEDERRLVCLAWSQRRDTGRDGAECDQAGLIDPGEVSGRDRSVRQHPRTETRESTDGGGAA
jgi:WhiB family transcriptional regulator, redox-sensing transcriptional regulator